MQIRTPEVFRFHWATQGPGVSSSSYVTTLTLDPIGRFWSQFRTNEKLIPDPSPRKAYKGFRSADFSVLFRCEVLRFRTVGFVCSHVWSWKTRRQSSLPMRRGSPMCERIGKPLVTVWREGSDGSRGRDPACSVLRAEWAVLWELLGFPL